MKHESSQLEHGQILVILVLALVALLAFTALSIDVGMIFTDRRYDQNVADSVAMAGSSAAAKEAITVNKNDPDGEAGSTTTFNCPNGFDFKNGTINDWVQQAMHNAYAAAWDRGHTNGFDLLPKFSEADLETAKEGIFIECINSYDPEVVGIYTHAMVSSTTNSNFAHFIFGGPLQNTVTAVARAQPFYSMYSGAALISLDSDSCSNGNNNDGGIWFDGKTQVTLHNGSAHSNTCMDKNGNGSGEVNLVGDPPPSAEYNTGNQNCNFEQNGVPGYCSEQLVPPVIIPRINLPVPDCDSLPKITTTIFNNTDTMEPGHYTNSINFHGADFNITMNPGLYCFDGDFTATATGSAGQAALTGIGVTVYMKNGMFSMTGQANYELSAPSSSSTADPFIPAVNDAMPGFLIIYRYASSTPDCANANTNDLKMEGTSSANYTGTIYAPCSMIDFGGTSDLVQSTAQLIGNTVKIHGSPTTDMYYDAKSSGLLSPVVNLQK